MEKVNSKEYWDERFVSGDWDHYDGDLQSAFFSQIALDAFPAWLDRNWHVMSGRFLTLDARRAAEQRRWLAVFPPVIPSVSMCQKRP